MSPYRGINGAGLKLLTDPVHQRVVGPLIGRARYPAVGEVKILSHQPRHDTAGRAAQADARGEVDARRAISRDDEAGAKPRGHPRQ